MNKMSKLVLPLLLLGLSFAVHAETETVDGIEWTFTVTDGKASVGGGDAEHRAVPMTTAGAITIPSTLGSCPVAAIGDSAFFGCYALTSVTIPEGVDSIGRWAFSGCALNSVTIPSSVTNVSVYGFSDCESLREIEVDSGNVFYSSRDGLLCDKAGTTVICCPGGRTGAVTVPAGVTCICEYAFSGVPSLTSVTIPASVTEIVWRAFRNSTLLTAVCFKGDAPLSCGPEIYGYSPNVTTYVLVGSKGWDGNPESTAIPEAWQGQPIVAVPSELTVTFDLGEHGTRTGGGELSQSVAAMDAAVAPEVAAKVGWEFKGWNAAFDCVISNMTVTAVYESATPPDGVYTETVDGIEWTFTVTDGKASVGGGTYGKTAVPASTVGVITIPSTLGGCPVTAVGNYAFYGCTSLTSVTIPDGVTSIGIESFYDCRLLTSALIPAGVTNIGEKAFANCAAMTAIYVEVGNPFYSSLDGLLYDKSGTVVICCPGGRSGTVSISEGVTNVCDWAFGSCCSVSEVTIPASVKRIGSSAFFLCYSLSSMTIPEGVTSIGDQAFGNCWNLKSVKFAGAAPTAVGRGIYTSASADLVTTVSSLDGWKGPGEVGLPSPALWPVGDTDARPIRLANGVYTETVDGIEWTFRITDGKASVGGGTETSQAVSTETAGAITIPSTLGNCPVTAIGEMAFYDCDSLTLVTIPDGVTDIGSHAFYRCSSLASVTIPASVTNIGEIAFLYCSSLTSVTIPANVTNIGDSAFSGCGSLLEIKVDSENAFYSSRNGFLCDKAGTTVICCPGGLTEVAIPDGVTSIGDRAFRDCYSLSSVTIPSSVTSIGDRVFLNCYSLTSVTIPDGVTNIGNGVFYSCTSLTLVTIPEGVTNIGYAAFFNCSSLSSVMIPDSVKSIEDMAFYWCTSLTSVTIPDGVTSIGDGVFLDCYSLTSVTIPASVTSIGDRAFRDCNLLNAVCFMGNAPLCGADIYVNSPAATTYVLAGSKGWDGNPESTAIPATWPVGDSDARPIVAISGPFDVTFDLGEHGTRTGGGELSQFVAAMDAAVAPEVAANVGWEFKGWNAAFDCVISNMTVTAVYESATPPDGVYTETVDGIEWTFTVTDGKASVGGGSSSKIAVPASTVGAITIPSTLGGCPVTAIGNSAFYDCYALTSVTIPEGVTSIGDSAFMFCNVLTSVTIPASVMNIGTSVFAGCESLREIAVDEGSPSYSNRDGLLCDKSGKTVICCPGGRTGEVTIPDGVTFIGNEAFQGCYSVTTVTVPESVTTIGRYEFANCPALTSVYFNGNAPTNGLSVYADSPAVTNYVRFGSKGWDGNPESTALPATWQERPIRLIDGGHYTETVDGIKWTFTITGGKATVGDWLGSPAIPETTAGAITVPTTLGGCQVTEIGGWAFYGCSSLTSVTIPDGVTSIGGRAFCFSGLTSILLPASVTDIADYAFAWCYSLTTVTIPASVTNIGKEAFSGCTSLPSVTIPASVTSIGEGAFDGCASLLEIVVDGENAFYSSHNGLLCDKAGTTMICCPGGLTEVAIPDGVTSIGEAAFYWCSSLTSVTIPDGVTSIGDRAFRDCNLLNAVCFMGNAPLCGLEIYGYSPNVTTYVLVDSKGWDGNLESTAIPATWPVGDSDARPIVAISGPFDVTFDLGEHGTRSGGGELSQSVAAMDAAVAPEVAVDFGWKFKGWNAAFDCVVSNMTVAAIYEKVGGLIEIGGNGPFDPAALPTPPAPEDVGESLTGVRNVLKVYDGKATNVTVEVTVPSEGATVKFRTDDMASWTDAAAFGGFSTVGTHTVWYAVEAEGYAAVTNYAWVSILPRPLTVIADDKDVVLGGDAPEFSVAYEGFVNGEDERTLGGTLEFACDYDKATAKVGDTFDIFPSGLTSYNYEISFVHGTLTVEPKPDGTYSEVVDGVTWTFRVRNCEASIGDGVPRHWDEASKYKGDITIPTKLGGCPVTGIGDHAFFNCTNKMTVTIPEGVRYIAQRSFAYSGLTAVTIPGSVTNIDLMAFYLNAALTSVTLVEGVTGIGQEVFSCCYALPSVTIPGSVTSVGPSAFANCSSLTSVTIQEGVVSIEGGAFYGCTSLPSVTIPASVTNIEGSAFSGCTSLQEIAVDGENAFYSIRNGFLCDKAGTTVICCPGGWTGEVAIPDGVTRIGNSAFEYCTSLTAVTIPESVTSIGNSAFEYCTSLTAVTIPASVTEIVWRAFLNSTLLTAVCFKGDAPPSCGPEIYGYSPNVTTYVLAGSKGWDGNPESTAIPATWPVGDSDARPIVAISGPFDVTFDLGEHGTRTGGGELSQSVAAMDAAVAPEVAANVGWSFTGWSAPFDCIISNMTIAALYESAMPTNGVYTEVVDGLEWTFVISNGKASVGDGRWDSPAVNKETAGDITIPDVLGGCPVIGISDYAFYDCTSLTSVTIPDGVTSIGDRAFRDCYLLSSVTIPSSVASIGDGAFWDCDGLTSVTIPEGVISIGEHAFDCCGGLTSVTIPEGVTSIGDWAFMACSSLTSVTIPGSVMSIGDDAFHLCSSLTSVTMLEGVTSIGYNAFVDCRSLTSVTIPASVTNIGGTAFFNCSSLTSVTIPDGVTSIGDGVFLDCHSLTSVTISASVTSIGEGAFADCTSLPSVTIPASVTNIEGSAFSGCTSLQEIAVDGENAFYSIRNGFLCDKAGTTVICCPGGWTGEVAIPDGVTRIGDCAFLNCDGLTTVTIPAGVTSIGELAFSDCHLLTSVFIPEGVTSIRRCLFDDCSSLTSVTIPASVTSIWECAFSSCDKLDAVMFRGNAPQLIFEDRISGSNLYNYSPDVTTYVLAGSKGWNGNPESTAIPATWPVGDGPNARPIRAISGLFAVAFDLGEHGTRAGGGELSQSVAAMDAAVAPEVAVDFGWKFKGWNAPFDCVISNMTVAAIYEKVGGLIEIGGKGPFDPAALPTTPGPEDVGESPTGVRNVSKVYDGKATNVTVEVTVPAEGATVKFRTDDMASWTDAAAFGGFSTVGTHTVWYAVEAEGYAAVTNYAWVSILPCPLAVIADDKDVVLGGRTPTFTVKYEGFVNSEDERALGGTLEFACAYDKATAKVGDTFDIVPSGLTSDNYEIEFVNGTLTVEPKPDGTYSEVVDGVTWTFRVRNCEASIGDGVPRPPEDAPEFKGDITVPSKLGGCPVTGIGEYAFFNCADPMSVIIPEGVRYIAQRSFAYSGLTAVTIPGSVTNIDLMAFYLDEALTSVTLVEGVTGIGQEVFSCCYALPSVTIPGSVTSVGPSAFANCSSLTSVTIQEGVVSIGDRAFRGCSSLTSVTIPASVTSIGDGAFHGCTSLLEIAVDGENAFYSSRNGLLCNKTGTTMIFCPGGMAGEVTIPKKVTNIWDKAFAYCPSLTKVTFDGDAPTCGYDIYYDSPAVTNYVRMGSKGWDGNPESTALPATWQERPIRLIDGGPYTETVNGVTWTFAVVDGGAAIGGGSVRQTAVSTRQIGEVVVPATLAGCPVVAISKSAFENCTDVTSVVIPEGVRRIDGGAFRACTGLVSVSLPSTLESVGMFAFYGCKALKEVSFSDRLSSLGAKAFLSCNALEKAYFTGDVPAGLAASGLVGTSTLIYYPGAYAAAYAAIVPENQRGAVRNLLTTVVRSPAGGKSVEVPDAWSQQELDARFGSGTSGKFTAQYGRDLVAALFRKTGKFDAAGRPLTVMDDFIAGTDPTDESSVFRADVKLGADGLPHVTWLPDLNENGAKAVRVYRLMGATSPTGPWRQVESAENSGCQYFKVTAELP